MRTEVKQEINHQATIRGLMDVRHDVTQVLVAVKQNIYAISATTTKSHEHSGMMGMKARHTREDREHQASRKSQSGFLVSTFLWPNFSRRRGRAGTDEMYVGEQTAITV